jgi:uncharacterized protein with von Willebrand factor type A (vWA) domain
MTTDAEKKILDRAIAAIRAEAAERADQDARHGDWYQLGIEHATGRAIQELELLRDAW